ncbi:protein mono-ADP-ribosyltransferase PARP14-like isoform X1 [Mya arenaria]|nr:protein mono-ADP-ribosyltransferase PARP14-like isoform X1 [Mya arenaria]
MESTIKDDSSKESHNAGSTADEHVYVHLYPRLDGTGPLGPPDMTGLNGRMPMQSHVPPPGGPRFMYPPVPQNVWYPQMQPHNMYANYPENTPYLGPPRPPGPVGQFPMQYFNPMPYPLNYPTSNAPLAVPSEFKPHTKPKPDDKNAHADKKQTRLNKKAVINEPFEEEKADGSDPSAQLLLRCVPKEVSRDVLELFLENKNRSGGGSVKELTLNKRSGVAYVTFEDFRDAENVLRKAKQSGTLYLPTSKCDLEVIRFEETQHAHYFHEIPHTSVFVKNIAVDSSDETLKNYFEVRCKAKPTDVIRSLSRKTALFEFEDTIDISSMTRAFGHNQLEGNILEMIEVQETRQVKVTGVKAGTSPQVLKLYFDNHARSKGGEVQTVEKVDKDNSFIVTFVHPEDARQVAHAPHILDGLKLSANLYNALLDTDPDSVVTIPEVVDVSGIDQNIVRFLQNSKEYRNKVENCVKDAFGQLIWTNEDGGIRLQVSCDVKPNDSDVLGKITIWKENHTKWLDWVRKEVIAIEINDAFEEILAGVKMDMEGIVVKNPDRIVTFVKKGGLSILVIGERQEGEKLAKTIKQIILKRKQDYEKGTKPVSESIPLKWFERILFRDKRVSKLLGTTDVEITHVELSNGITFSGVHKDVQKALVKLSEAKHRIRKNNIQGLSEQCLELLGSVEMQEIIRQRLSQKDILAVCSRDSREIFTFELTSGDADHAVKVVKRCVTEFSLDLTDEQIQCLETDEGAHFIKQIMGEHQGLLTVVILRTGSVQVTCLYSLCRDIENEVETFVESNARYELFIRVRPEVFRCINMHARYALTSAEKEHDVTITKIKERGNDGYRVAGKKTSAQKGVNKVEEICKHVIKHEVSVEWPGFDKYLQSQNGKYDLSQVEHDEKCLIVFPHQQEERQRNIYDRTDKPNIGIKIVAEGSIVYQKVDVIVNATNQKLDMSVGVVSQQLLKVAGAELQTECTRKYPNGIKFGKVAKTTSGKMKHCKAIIHGTLPRWTTDNAQKVLENLMTECLKTADQDGYTTIAFPALGTGRCEYPSDVVADTLIKSVMEYENDHPDTNIKCVSFVIWSKDVETIKAFTKTKEEMSKRQKQKDRRRTEPDSRRQTQTTALTVYTNKPQNIRRIESRIKEFRKEDEIFPPASLLEQLTDDRMEVVKKIARENKTKLVKTDKSLKMIGYGNSVKLTKTKVESYMDNVEKDLKLTLQSLQSLKAKGAVSFPASWSKTDITDPLKIVNLAPTDPDYVTVSAKFLAETRLSPANIVKIERIQNPALYGQYFAKKKHMESAGGVSNEKMLWHGTRTPEVAAIIQKKGFDRNYNHGAAIGVGVYFAVNANMSASGYCSPDKMGHKYIFHACVLTGDSGVGSGGIRFPPPKVPGNPLITFDSTCDNVANPSMFAVFHDAQAYPSFMITFK